MESFLKINGTPYPQPFRGTSGYLEQQVATMVDAGRNANGVTVGQIVGRNVSKINQLRWAYLKADVWSAILQEFKRNFYSQVTYFDMEENDWITRTMYCGDRSAKPFHVDHNTGKVLDYVDCLMNLIDTGA